MNKQGTETFHIVWVTLNSADNIIVIIYEGIVRIGLGNRFVVVLVCTGDRVLLPQRLASRCAC
jgi:hypothetical protein